MDMGKLYGIGVGPGAPDLITLRAVNILRNAVDVILAPASPKNESSIALEIVKQYLREGIEILRLDFPMTRNRDDLEAAWSKAANASLQVLRKNRNAAFLTLGDPLIYSTFSYLAAAMRSLEPQLSIEIVPGITSFQAAAARVRMPLCEGEESLHIISGISSASRLESQLAACDNAAILKVYRNYETIRTVVKKAGRQSVLASFVEREGENIQKRLADGKPPYMSLILCKKDNS